MIAQFKEVFDDILDKLKLLSMSYKYEKFGLGHLSIFLAKVKFEDKI